MVLSVERPLPLIDAGGGASATRRNANGPNVTRSEKTELARLAVEALELRRLRDSGNLTQEEYVDRLRALMPAAHNRRLPSAEEILKRCDQAPVRKKSA
jgi:hypothetical protein